MRILLTLMLFFMMSATVAFGQVRKEITVYDPLDAIHPFKLLGTFIRPPIAVFDIWIRGAYFVLDSDPIRRAFNIEYRATFNIDEDY